MLVRVFLALLLATSAAAQEDIPEVARTLMEDAARAASAKRVDDAIAKYEQVLKIAPDVTPAYTNLGSLYYGKGDAAKALDVFQRGLEKSPTDRTLLTNAATAAQQLGKPADALVLVDRALERVQRDAGLLALRSTILRSLDRNEEALKAIDQALEIAPREARYAFARGNLLFQLHRNDEAIGAYQQAIGSDRTYLRAYYNLGAVLFETGRYSEALQSYKVALEPVEKQFAKKEAVDQAYAPAYANLGAIYLKQQQWSAAADAYAKAIRLDAKSASAHYSLGFVYFSTSQWDKAIPEYDAALALDPALPLAWLHLAQIATRKGEYAKAVAALEKGKSYFEGATKLQALHTSGRAHLALGNRSEARAAFEEALSSDANDVIALLALARMQRSDHAYADAAKLVAAAERVAPSNPAVLLERALLSRAAGDDAAERRALDELLARDNRPELWPLRVERFLVMLRQNGVSDGPRELAALIASAPQGAAPTVTALRSLRAVLLAHAGAFEEARREAGPGSLLGAAIDALTAKRADAIRSLTLVPGSIVAKGDLGILLWQQNRKSDARGPLAEASKARPDWSEVSLALGETLLESREWEAAADALARCAPAASLAVSAQSIEASIGRNDTLCGRSQQALAIALLGAGDVERAIALSPEKSTQAAAFFLRGASELANGSQARARDFFTRALSIGLPDAAQAAARKNLAAIEESQRVEPEPEEEPVSTQVRRVAVVFLPDLPAENEKKLAEAVSASMNQIAAGAGVPLDVELFRRFDDARAFITANRDRIGVVVANSELVSNFPGDFRPRFQFEREGRATHRRVIVVPARSSTRSVADLRGRSISTADGLRDPIAPDGGYGNIVRVPDDATAMANVLYGKTDAAYVSEDNPLFVQKSAEERVIWTSPAVSLPVVAFAPMVESDRDALDRSFRGSIAGHALLRVERERPRPEPRRIEVATVPFSAFALKMPEPPAIVPLRVVVELPAIAIPEDLYRTED